MKRIVTIVSLVAIIIAGYSFLSRSGLIPGSTEDSSVGIPAFAPAGEGESSSVEVSEPAPTLEPVFTEPTRSDATTTGSNGLFGGVGKRFSALLGLLTGGDVSVDTNPMVLPLDGGNQKVESGANRFLTPATESGQVRASESYRGQTVTIGQNGVVNYYRARKALGCSSPVYSSGPMAGQVPPNENLVHPGEVFRCP